MKFAVLIVAACAFAGALGVPVSSHSNAGGVIDYTQALYEKIKELVESHNDLVRKIEAAGAESLSHPIQEAAGRVNGALRNALDELQASLSGPSSGPSDDEELSTNEGLRQRIDEIRKAIVAATSELAGIIWQQARAQGEKLSESLAVAKKKVLDRLSELKAELLWRLRELMIPDDDVPVTYVFDEIFEQIIEGLKNQIQDALGIISDWRNLLSESGKAKIAAAKKRITELTQKIADTIREWRRAKESEVSTESSNYASDPFYNDQLMVMLKGLLEETKDELDLMKLKVSKSPVRTERELLAHVEELDTAVSVSIESIREMIEEVIGVETASSDIVANLRKLLALKMQQLQQLIRNSADGEKIKTLEKEIVNLRRRLIKAVQDVFQKP